MQWYAQHVLIEGFCLRWKAKGLDEELFRFSQSHHFIKACTQPYFVRGWPIDSVRRPQYRSAGVCDEVADARLCITKKDAWEALTLQETFTSSFLITKANRDNLGCRIVSTDRLGHVRSCLQQTHTLGSVHLSVLGPFLLIYALIES